MIVVGRPHLAGRSPDKRALWEVEPEARAAGQLLRLVRWRDCGTEGVGLRLGKGSKLDKSHKVARCEQYDCKWC